MWGAWMCAVHQLKPLLACCTINEPSDMLPHPPLELPSPAPTCTGVGQVDELGRKGGGLCHAEVQTHLQRLAVGLLQHLQHAGMAAILSA